MDRLFHKVMVIADPHFGRGSNSPQANQDNLGYLEWAIDEARTWGAEQCIMLGDWFHNRHSVGVGTMHSALRGLEMVSDGFERSWFITGNHDLFYRDRRDITSIEFAKHIPNITLVNDPLVLDDVAFLPWLLKDEHKLLNVNSRYVFGHLELAGFLTNSSHAMPESEHTATARDFSGEVYTGHFHKRQVKANVCYTGNVMPFDFNDDNDTERGIMLLAWGGDPIFKSWPEQPLYRSVKLSQLLDHTDTILKPKMTVRVAVDVPLLHEEAQEMRETLVTAFGLRKVELMREGEEIDQEYDSDVEFQSVDQLVIDGLRSIESAGLSKDRLIEIYTNL